MDIHQLNFSTKTPHVSPRETRSLLFADMSTGCDSLPRDERSGLATRLGRYQIGLLLTSFAACLACLAFLTFLWASDTSNSVWLGIVLSGWTTRSVTITSLVLRWATAAQAMVCTSMLAAVLFEKGGVILLNAAALSIMRFDNTGPWSLLARMRAQWHHVPFSVGLLAFLLCFSTLVLQFSSTALLSQVGVADLPVSTTVPRTFYSTDPDGASFSSQIGSVPSYLETTPVAYPAFAEWISNVTESDSSAQPGEFAPSSRPGIRDTGTVMRAFLPVKDANERGRVIEYQGFGTVVDTRTVCMKPKLTNVVYSTNSGNRLDGMVEVEQKPMGLSEQTDSRNRSDFSLFFDCAFVAAMSGNNTASWGWPLALCGPRYPRSKYGIYSTMNPRGQENVGRSYLLINATTTDTVTTLDESDVWNSLSLQANDSKTNHVTVQVTLCMVIFEAQDMEIHATRPTPFLAEPAISWNTSTAAYETGTILHQLGAGSNSVSPEERGIFKLTPRSWQWPQRPEYISLTGGAFSTTSALEAVWYNTDGIYSGMVNEAQHSVLAQMASYTANPALALQAYLTTLCAMAYYDRIVMFDTAAASSRVALLQVTRPLGWSGYIIVGSLLVLHLVLVLLVTLLFYHAGKLSRIGNAWATVSQLLGPATDTWIRDADTVPDKTVQKWLKAREEHDTLIQVRKEHGRVLVVIKGKTP